MPKKKAGRTSKYQDEITDKKAFKLALLGLTNQQMAVALDISVETFQQWINEKSKYYKPEFSESIRNAKDHTDAKVYHAMYQRAIGYDVKEDKIFCNDGQVTVVPTTKHYPPDIPAQKAWLASRRKMKFNYDHDNTVDDLIDKAQQMVSLYLPDNKRKTEDDN